jgi:hypothetical protein
MWGGSLNFFVMQGVGQDILFSCQLNFASPPPVINNEWSLISSMRFADSAVIWFIIIFLILTLQSITYINKWLKEKDNRS